MRNSGQASGNDKEVIGLIPAGGQATRIAPLPCSKELYPIGFKQVDEYGGLRPKVVCHYLLEKMQLAGATKAYVILGNGKWDIPAYLGDGTLCSMHLAYLVINQSPGVPYTLDKAYPFVHEKKVALGFPDIIFQPEDTFTQLLKRQSYTNADVVLGLFPTDQHQKWDMVDLDKEGRILKIIIKPQKTCLRYTWVNAVWTPVFTHFMHQYLADIQKRKEQNSNEYKKKKRELYIGDIIQAAIQDDMKVDGVLFKDGNCLDIGTPEDMIRATKINLFV